MPILVEAYDRRRDFLGSAMSATESWDAQEGA
jgi:hypothetical protein